MVITYAYSDIALTKRYVAGVEVAISAIEDAHGEAHPCAQPAPNLGTVRAGCSRAD